MTLERGVDYYLSFVHDPLGVKFIFFSVNGFGELVGTFSMFGLR